MQIKSISLVFLLFLTTLESVKSRFNYFGFRNISFVPYAIYVVSGIDASNNGLYIDHALNDVLNMLAMQKPAHILLYKTYTNHHEWP